MVDKINKKSKVIVAMSGGVDSSVVAFLLKQQGYEVIGLFMQFWYPSVSDASDYGQNRCCSLESYQEALEVARSLDVPLYKVNFGRQFKRLIVDDFLSRYRRGHTPNPCINCNKFIKFDLLLKYAKEIFGADYLATGHYVKIKKNRYGKYDLFRPKDVNKDQTYFLYNLKQKQLKHLLFPLSNYDKSDVRKLAQQIGLKIFNKPDSQEICFVGKSHNDFLKKYLRLKSGEIIDSETQKKIGQHQGLVLYTLGQRSGIGLAGGPWYVSGFDRKKNYLLVSRQKPISKQTIRFNKVNWLDELPDKNKKYSAQIRHHGICLPCHISKLGKYWQADFSQVHPSAMPGQSIVFYEGKRLVGGGVIV